MKRSIVSAVMLLAAAMMLSGCICPWWGPGYGHDGYGHDGYRDGGYRGGGGRR